MERNSRSGSTRDSVLEERTPCGSVFLTRSWSGGFAPGQARFDVDQRRTQIGNAIDP